MFSEAMGHFTLRPAPRAHTGALKAIQGRGRTIAWIIRGDETYGVREGTLSLVKGLHRHGWSTPIVALRDGETARACREAGCDVYHVDLDLPRRPEGGTWRKAIHFLVHRRTIGRISRLIAAVLQPARPDAVHVRWPDLVTVAGRTAQSLGVPCFWHLPTTIRTGKWLGVSVPALFYQWQCRRYGILPLANSLSTAATLGELWIRPRVLYLGVDPERFHPGRVRGVGRRELDLPSEAIVLGVFGRVTPGKGQDRMLEAMLSVRQTTAPLHLLVVGGPIEGAYADRLRRVAAQHRAKDRLHMVGAVDDPERYYGAIDVALNAFLGAEGFGISVVEAMMMSKPVLVHASGGPAETVVDGVTGWHVSKPTVQALARGIGRALADRHHWPELGGQARQHALRNFSTDILARSYIGIVEQAIAKGSTRRTGTR